VCNDSVKHINLINMNAVRKLICVPEEITASKVKPLSPTFTFVSEDANNTSKCTSLLSGFTVVVIAFEIWIILDLLYNCISQQQK